MVSRDSIWLGVNAERIISQDSPILRLKYYPERIIVVPAGFEPTPR